MNNQVGVRSAACSCNASPALLHRSWWLAATPAKNHIGQSPSRALLLTSKHPQLVSMRSVRATHMSPHGPLTGRLTRSFQCSHYCGCAWCSMLTWDSVSRKLHRFSEGSKRCRSHLAAATTPPHLMLMKDPLIRCQRRPHLLDLFHSIFIHY